MTTKVTRVMINCTRDVILGSSSFASSARKNCRAPGMAWGAAGSKVLAACRRVVLAAAQTGRGVSDRQAGITHTTCSHR